MTTVNVVSIRPKIVFAQCERQLSVAQRRFVVNLPSSDIGGLTLLESSILVSLCKLIKPQHIFEFGTFMGATSSLLALNTDDNCQIVTLDLPRETSELVAVDDSQILSNGMENDKYLSQQFIRSGAVYLQDIEPGKAAKVSQLYENSCLMDIEQHGFVQRFELIFIDGGHDYDTVRIDTQNAMRMKAENSIVIWHDYKSAIHGDVSRFLDEYSNETPLIHVENTMLAFALFGRYQTLLSQ